MVFDSDVFVQALMVAATFFIIAFITIIGFLFVPQPQDNLRIGPYFILADILVGIAVVIYSYHWARRTRHKTAKEEGKD